MCALYKMHCTHTVLPLSHLRQDFVLLFLLPET